ncbi:hypothetical protein [Streptomyces cavernae]|uniref:hypothetical protein n=1 Tax=Streptomyces cavernae TaxID=2259034 RepID=UPI000FEBA28C|nr:hypothetical protein [Streptomyces cavernae]
MSARTRTRPNPARPGGVEIRLPWWGFALPTVAFVALLLVILNPADAQAAGSDPVISQLVERIQQSVQHTAP